MKKRLLLSITMLSICMTFLFYKYLLQLFPSVMSDALMKQYNLNGEGLGNLAACFFYGYFILQLVAGPLIDRYGVRLIASAALLCSSTSVYLFSISSTIIEAEMSRMLMGAGGAFATVCYLRCCSNWCTAKRMALAGGCLTIGVMLGACLAQAPLAVLLDKLGSQGTQQVITFAGIMLFILTATCLRNGTQKTVDKSGSIFSGLTKIMQNPTNWLLALYSGFAFAPLAVFGGLWGIPFAEASYHLPKTSAASLVSLCYIGFAIGGPLFGYLSDRKGQRFKWMLIGLTLSGVCLAQIIYLPYSSNLWISLCMLGFGISTGSFMLGFTLGKELNPVLLAGSLIGFINSGDALLGAVTEPLVGHLLDSFSHTKRHHGFTVSSFHHAFALLLGYLFIACVFAYLAHKRETNKATAQQKSPQTQPQHLTQVI